MGMLDQYFDFHDKASAKFPSVAAQGKLVTVMEVGSFYEIYQITHPTPRGADLVRVCGLMNILCTRKDKQAAKPGHPITTKNPMMAGFTSTTFSKYLRVLLANNYTVVQVVQSTPAPAPVREVLAIHSPSTSLLDGVSGCPEIVCVVVETLPCGRVRGGMSRMDLSTGNGFVTEVDRMDDVLTWLRGTTPREAIFVGSTDQMTEIASVIAHRDIPTHHYTHADVKDTGAMHYMNETMRRVYDASGPLTPLECFGLERMMLASQAWTLTIDFVCSHDPTLLRKSAPPEIENAGAFCCMDRNALVDLKVLPVQDYVGGWTRHSLLKTLDHTVTAMGRRMLRDRLVHPLRSVEAIKVRQNRVGVVIKHVGPIRQHLGGVLDLERLQRSWAMERMPPSAWYRLVSTYELIRSFIDELDDSVLEAFGDQELRTCRGTVELVLKRSGEAFHHESMSGLHSFGEMKESFLVCGASVSHDGLRKNIAETDARVLAIQREIETELGFRVALKFSERDGWRFHTTAKRSKSLDRSRWSTRVQGNVAKITNETVDQLSLTKAGLVERLRAETRERYEEVLRATMSAVRGALPGLVRWVAAIDCAQSVAWCSLRHGYVCPTPTDTPDAFFRVRGMRHPIVERVQTNEAYVPNDFDIGGAGAVGVCLFAPNAAGKSTLMGALGLVCCMAQAGMWVPADEFEWTPVDAIFTRINATDSIGVSSFMAEMLQLRNIVHRATNRSLVLSDEACNMTEHVSGVSLSAAMLMRMVARKTCFLFATHLHQLIELEPLVSLRPRIAFKHLAVEMDKGEIRYVRKLREGAGERVYGLKVAKHVLDDTEFWQDALAIQRVLLDRATLPMTETTAPGTTEPSYRKKSQHNKSFTVDRCEICLRRVDETHHIRFQSTADDHGMIETDQRFARAHKNSPNNLVGLCAGCHDQVHAGKIAIVGWSKSTDGVKLEWKKIVSRLTAEEREFVRSSTRTTSEAAKDFKHKFGRTVSCTTVRRVRSGA